MQHNRTKGQQQKEQEPASVVLDWQPVTVSWWKTTEGTKGLRTINKLYKSHISDVTSDVLQNIFATVSR